MTVFTFIDKVCTEKHFMVYLVWWITIKRGRLMKKFLTKKNLYYSGLEKEQYDAIKEAIYEDNRKKLQTFSFLSAWGMLLIGHFIREEWGIKGNKMSCSHLFWGDHASHQHPNPAEAQFQFPLSTVGKAMLTTHISLCQNISLTRQSVDSLRVISPMSSAIVLFPLF